MGHVIKDFSSFIDNQATWLIAYVNRREPYRFNNWLLDKNAGGNGFRLGKVAIANALISALRKNKVEANPSLEDQLAILRLFNKAYIDVKELVDRWNKNPPLMTLEEGSLGKQLSTAIGHLKEIITTSLANLTRQCSDTTHIITCLVLSELRDKYNDENNRRVTTASLNIQISLLRIFKKGPLDLPTTYTSSVLAGMIKNLVHYLAYYSVCMSDVRHAHSKQMLSTHELNKKLRLEFRDHLLKMGTQWLELLFLLNLQANLATCTLSTYTYQAGTVAELLEQKRCNDLCLRSNQHLSAEKGVEASADDDAVIDLKAAAQHIEKNGNLVERFTGINRRFFQSAAEKALEQTKNILPRVDDIPANSTGHLLFTPASDAAPGDVSLADRVAFLVPH